LRFRYTDQEAYQQAGNVLANLVKGSLATSVSTANAEFFWHAISLRGEEPALAELDILFSACGSVFGLLRFPVWIHKPVLFLLALVAL
jgi:hypothetical protein